MKLSSQQTPAVVSAVRARWQGLNARERTLVDIASLAIGMLIPWVAISPALNTLQKAETQQRVLAGQVQRMQLLSTEAAALTAEPKLSQTEALPSLEASVRQRLGNTATLQVAGDRATLTLKNTPAAALTQWLAQARAQARVVPTEAKLVRSPPPTVLAAGAGAPSAAGTATWDGSLVLILPPR